MNFLKLSVCGAILFVLLAGAVACAYGSDAADTHTVTFSLEGEGEITVYYNGPISSGDEVPSGAVLGVFYRSLDGLHECSECTIDGDTYDIASGYLEYTVTGDVNIEMLSEYCLSGSYKNTYSVGIPTSFVAKWVYGEGGKSTGMNWTNMVFQPSYYGDYIYAKLDRVLFKLNQSGELQASVDTGSMKSYYQYLAVGNGQILDAATGKVYDPDLNQLFVLSNTANMAHYYGGNYYLTVGSGNTTDTTTYCYSATDSDDSTGTNVQDPLWSAKLGIPYMASIGASQLYFGDGFILTTTSDASGNVGICTVDPANGDVISKVTIPAFEGLNVGKGYLNIDGGMVTMTAYLLNSDFEANVAVLDVDGSGNLSNLRTALIRDTSYALSADKSTSLITNGYYGYLLNGGTFYVVDMSDLSVVASESGYRDKLVGVHGNMTITTAYSGMTYAYVIPYKNTSGSDVYVFCHDMDSGSLTVDVQSGIIAYPQYCSQQAHFLENGDMVFVNDTGRMFCMGSATDGPSGVQISESSIILREGESKKLTASAIPVSASGYPVTWSSDNTSVATVDSDGNVTAVASGTTTIRASVSEGAYEATCTVKVAKTFTSYDGTEYSYVTSGDGSSTRYECTLVSASGTGSTLYVPASIEGYNVYAVLDGAFTGSSATAVVLPVTIESVGDAFSSVVEDIYFLGDKPDWTAPSGVTVHTLPDASGWSGTTEMTTETITDLFDSETVYADVAGTVTVVGCTPSSTGQIIVSSEACGGTVTAIGAYVFGQMDPGIGSEKTVRTDIYSVSIPEGVTIIRERAFFYNGGMVAVELPESLEIICDEAFRYADSLETVSLSEGVTYIGFEGFRDTHSVKVFAVPDSVTFLGEGFIKSQVEDTPLRILIIGAGVDDFPNYGCNNRKNLEAVIFSEGLETIGEYAFQGCISLKYVELPSTMQNTAAYAFCDCTSMEHALISGAVAGNAFSGCTSLSTIDFREMDGTKISASAFAGCSSLTDAYFVGKGPSFDKTAFAGQSVNLHYDSAYEVNWKGRSITGCTKVADVAGTTAVNITGSKASLNASSTLAYTADGSFSNLAWSSSDETVAVVSGGYAYGLKEGTFTVKAVSADGVEATAEVTVSSVGVTGVSLSKTSAGIHPGDKMALTATITPSDASETRVTWASSDLNVATVDDKGNVTAVGEGSCTITVTTVDGGYKATCEVTVSASSSGNSLLIYGVAGAVAVAAIAGVAFIMIRRH